jgi:hypothetical protein
MTELALLGVGLIAGGAVAWFLAASHASGTVAELRSQIGLQQTTLQAKDREINSLHQQVLAARRKLRHSPSCTPWKTPKSAWPIRSTRWREKS